MMASRASLTQSGQSESVWRGQPSVGLGFSQDLRSGLSDHFGVNDGFGLCLLKNWMVLKVPAAALQTAQSIVRRICVPTRFGINLHPLFQMLRPTLPFHFYPTPPLLSPEPTP